VLLPKLDSQDQLLRASSTHDSPAAERGRPRATGGEKNAGQPRVSIGEAEDFQAALSADGVAGLLVTGHGQFRARLTQVELDRLRLTAVEEAQPRIGS
jgi:hypothetical protein